MTFQKRIALGKLLLDAFGMASGDQSLPVAILLMTSGTGGRTSRTFGMLGITLIGCSSE